MRFLITGGAGFLGSHLVKRCLREPGAEITVLDSLEFPSHSLPANLKSIWERISYVRGNVCNSKLLQELIPYQDVIFHCAAQTSHILSIQDPKTDAAVNVEGTLKVLEVMRFFNQKAILVYPSTTSVIGKPQQAIADESHPMQPLDIYSLHKSLAERYCFSYAKLHDIKAVILRFSNLYGPGGKGQPEYGFINHFIHQALHHEALHIFGTGEQLRNVTYVEDAAELMMKAVGLPAIQGRPFFATSPFHLSVKEIAETIVTVFQSGIISSVEWPEDRRRIEVGSVKFTSKALEEFVTPIASTDFTSGIQKTFLALSNPRQNFFA